MRVDPTYISNLVSALDGAQIREQQLSNQLASGVRINSLGDDPVSAGRNVLLLNQIQRDDAFSQTSSLVTGQLQVADSALGGVVSQLNQAISLATSANQWDEECERPEGNREPACRDFRRSGVVGEQQLPGAVHFCGGQTRNAAFLDFECELSTDDIV